MSFLLDNIDTSRSILTYVGGIGLENWYKGLLPIFYTTRNNDIIRSASEDRGDA